MCVPTARLAPETRLNPSGSALRRDGITLQTGEGHQGHLRAAQHDQRGLPHHPPGHGTQGALHHRLSQARLRPEVRGIQYTKRGSKTGHEAIAPPVKCTPKVGHKTFGVHFTGGAVHYDTHAFLIHFEPLLSLHHPPRLHAIGCLRGLPSRSCRVAGLLLLDRIVGITVTISPRSRIPINISAIIISFH